MDSARYGICRHFINGSCRFGPRCKYRHEWPVLPPVLRSSQICRYFQKGGCWYGERCRYLHVHQPQGLTAVTGRRGSVPAVSSSSVAHSQSERRGSEPAFLRAAATSRHECSGSEFMVNASNTRREIAQLPDNIAEEQSPENDLESIQSSGVAQAGACQRNDEGTSTKSQEDGAGAAAAAAPSAKSDIEETEAFLQSRNVTCGICMEKVYDKVDKKDHIFGILPNCNHPFCLECITTWRRTKELGPDVVRTCPQCRVRSAFYVPNKYWVEGQAKDNVIAAFKKKFSKKRCCFYDRYGCCPFKTECLYRHIKHSNRVAFSYFSDDDEDDDGLDLLSFFITMTLLGGDEDTDDEDSPFYLTEEFGV
ncbi:makorin, ring finger protein, 4 [Odontesthes bonariensis]|uniref:makorin, ring finger protein, 4 n=1 Tax=Odontesthes bonariensis TaxID=219752 RepID=UPI003F58E456